MVASLKPEALIGGRYRLDRSIAAGGMAEVWLALDEQLQLTHGGAADVEHGPAGGQKNRGGDQNKPKIHRWGRELEGDDPTESNRNGNRGKGS